MFANFLEAEWETVTTGSKIWMGMFAFHSVALPLIGVVDFSSYVGDAAFDAAAAAGTPYSPPIPWPILWYLDWGALGPLGGSWNPLEGKSVQECSIGATSRPRGHPPADP